jgi:glycosyltransferase involved in cell wall biosynthesis
MKVCIATHSFLPRQGAAEFYLSRLCQELVREGVEVCVVTSGRRLVREDGRIRVYRVPNPYPTNFQNFSFMRLVRRGLELAWAEEEFDVLQSEHVFPILEAQGFAREAGISHLGVIEGISKVSAYSKLVYLTHRIVLPRVRSTRLVCWSRFLVEEYLRNWGVEPSRVEIVPGGVDTKLFSPSAGGGDYRERMGNPGLLVSTAKPLYHTNAVYVVKGERLEKRAVQLLARVGNDVLLRGELEVEGVHQCEGLPAWRQRGRHAARGN